jgi:hypothetical protein
MDDIDLKNIQLHFPNTRTFSKDDSSVVEERVETGRGSVLVAVKGKRSKPAILTYHDLGLNCEYRHRRLLEERCSSLFYVSNGDRSYTLHLLLGGSVRMRTGSNMRIVAL